MRLRPAAVDLHRAELVDEESQRPRPAALPALLQRGVERIVEEVVIPLVEVR